MVGAKTLLGFVKCQKYWLCYGWSRYPSARPSDVDYLLICKVQVYTIVTGSVNG